MATDGPTPASRTLTNDPSTYDHAINLVDATNPNAAADPSAADEEPLSSGASLTRKWTTGTLRKELAKRKYAKWQRDKNEASQDIQDDLETIGGDLGERYSTAQPRKSLDDGARSGRNKKQISLEIGQAQSKPKATQKSVIDVLYENQRGWFFFGIPLYSANSLLNLDPAPWQTSTFRDSPVNITNAQVPDPSWQWDWKTWYVDMSHDVDEQGWEYSFSFQPRFAWHGSHPWFHSFARRRRWLRKRVKVHSRRPHGRHGDMKEAHLLNADYFTIHGSRRSRSPLSSAGNTLHNRSSSTGYDGLTDDVEQDLNDIPNVLALLAALRKATVDRERIVAMTAFLKQGEEELFYLADNMKEIMDLFIYQTSRQRVYNDILDSMKTAKNNSDKPVKDEKHDPDAADRKIKSLEEAIHAAKAYLEGLEYWSDAIPSKDDRLSILNPSTTSNGDKTSADQAKAHIEHETNTTEFKIKGIPEEAHTEIAPSPLRTAHSHAEQHGSDSLDKGKGKARE